jgi:hypothetical protein
MASGSVIQEYLIGLGFKLDDPASKRFNETLDRTAKSFVKVGAEAVEMASAVGLAVEKIASQYEDLYYLSQRTGATIQSLQATAYGFTQIGLSAGDAKGMVDSLAMTLRTQPGTGGLLSALGVGAGDANKQAHDLVKQLSHMPFYVASQYAGQFGISPQQLLMMENGLADLDRAEADHIRRQNEAGIATEDLGDKSHKFMTELRKMEDEFGILETKIGQDFIGPATAVVDEITQMTEWFLKADDATKGWLSTLASLAVTFGAVRAAGALLAGVAGMFGAGAGTKAAIGTATGAGLVGFLGRVSRGGTIAAAGTALLAMKADSENGNELRSWLRGLLGLPDDPNEPAPWAPGGSWSPFGNLSDVPFGGAANPFHAAAAPADGGDTSGRMTFSRGVQNFNPGNIAWGPWAAAHGATGGRGQDSGHLVAVFPDYATGTEAQRELLLQKYGAGRTTASSLIAAPGGYTPGNMQAATNVAPGGNAYADLNLTDPESMARFQRSLIRQEVGGSGADYIFAHGGAPLGSDIHTGDRNVTIAPVTTMHISGGTDPKVTADYALAGLDNSWANLVRNSGATVR